MPKSIILAIPPALLSIGSTYAAYALISTGQYWGGAAAGVIAAGLGYESINYLRSANGSFDGRGFISVGIGLFAQGYFKFTHGLPCDVVAISYAPPAAASLIMGVTQYAKKSEKLKDILNSFKTKDHVGLYILGNKNAAESVFIHESGRALDGVKNLPLLPNIEEARLFASDEVIAPVVQEGLAELVSYHQSEYERLHEEEYNAMNRISGSATSKTVAETKRMEGDFHIKERNKWNNLLNALKIGGLERYIQEIEHPASSQQQ